MPPDVVVNVHLNDADRLVCLPHPTCYAPFVAVRLTEGVSLFLGDVATVEALAAVIANARDALLAIEANAACPVS